MLAFSCPWSSTPDIPARHLERWLIGSDLLKLSAQNVLLAGSRLEHCQLVRCSQSDAGWSWHASFGWRQWPCPACWWPWPCSGPSGPPQWLSCAAPSQHRSVSAQQPAMLLLLRACWSVDLTADDQCSVCQPAIRCLHSCHLHSEQLGAVDTMTLV